MRIHEHPILGSLPDTHLVTITVDGRPILARSGEPIWAALMAAGIVVAHYTHTLREPRGAFCGIGRCTDCAMTVDGVPNVRTCVAPVQEGMVVETQDRLEP
ncbi:MAG: (2Fe-2S)-binding protein [Bacillota bacterium]